MSFTETEALTKWCPFARVIPGVLEEGVMRAVAGVTAHNRVQETGEREPTWHGAMMCVGSACMAWTWCGGNSAGRGYCGLAGKP